jgi:hypothetical protein
MFKKVFGTKNNKAKERFKALDNEELCDVHDSANTVLIVISRTLR